MYGTCIMALIHMSKTAMRRLTDMSTRHQSHMAHVAAAVTQFGADMHVAYEFDCAKAQLFLQLPPAPARVGSNPRNSKTRSKRGIMYMTCTFKYTFFFRFLFYVYCTDPQGTNTCDTFDTISEYLRPGHTNM